MMKRMADHMLVNGINYFVPHAFTPKYPDSDCPPYFYYKGKNPQHQLFGRLMQYMQRVSHVLSGGTHQASAAVLYNAEAEWAGGDYMLFQKPCKALTRAQIDFDIVHEDLLYKEDTLVKDGQLCIGGEAFGALIVPYSELLPYRLVEAMARLAKQGLRVWFIDGLCADSSEHRDIRCFDPLFCTVPLSELTTSSGRGAICTCSTTRTPAGLSTPAYTFRTQGRAYSTMPLTTPCPKGKRPTAGSPCTWRAATPVSWRLARRRETYPSSPPGWPYLKGSARRFICAFPSRCKTRGRKSLYPIGRMRLLST